MSLGTNIRTLGLDYFNTNYRFGITDSNETKTIQESVYTPGDTKAVLYENLGFEKFNQALLNLEKSKDKSAVILDYNGHPKELAELFKKVANGKYGSFIKQNADGFVFGRNFEKKSSAGVFLEDLGAVASSEVAEEITAGSLEKLIYVDTYNFSFNMLESDSEGDELFTEFAQMLSVFGNELKQAYFLDTGYVSDDSKAYEFMKEAFVEVQDYLADGNSFSFVKKEEQEVFGVALQLMIDNLDSYIDDSNSDGRVVINFQASA